MLQNEFVTVAIWLCVYYQMDLSRLQTGFVNVIKWHCVKFQCQVGCILKMQHTLQEIM
jgi:hypothetical protein